MHAQAPQAPARDACACRATRSASPPTSARTLAFAPPAGGCPRAATRRCSLETLDDLGERFPEELPSRDRRRCARSWRPSAPPRCGRSASGERRATCSSRSTRRAPAAPTWIFARDGFDALSPGLRRIYRRGRKRMRAARRTRAPRTSTSGASASRTCGTRRRSSARRSPSAWSASSKRAHKLADHARRRPRPRDAARLRRGPPAGRSSDAAVAQRRCSPPSSAARTRCATRRSSAAQALRPVAQALRQAHRARLAQARRAALRPLAG